MPERNAAGAPEGRSISILCGEPIDTPRLKPAVRAELEQFYKELVTQLSVANATNPQWWASWLSSRDRFLSVLWDRLVALERLWQLLKTQPSDVTFAAPDGETAAVAGALARSFGYRVRVRAAARVRFVSNAILLWMRRLLRLAGVSWWTLSWIRLARKSPIPADSLRNCDRLIVTMLGANVGSADAYFDTYFGELHRFFEKHGLRAAYCGNLQAPPGEVLPRLRLRNAGPPITTFGHFLRPGDLWTVLREVLPLRIETSATSAFHGKPIESIVRMDLMVQAPAIFLARLIHRAAPRLLAAAPRAEVVHMFENNPWERAVYEAASRAIPMRRVTGFLHCAVLPSHYKNFIAEKEAGIRPMPQRVVCTGPAAQTILSGLGAYPEGLLLAGCDLRGPALATLARRAAPRPSSRPNILLILEGLRSMWKAVECAERLVDDNPTLNVRIREHPALPLAEISRQTGRSFRLGGRLEVERPCPLAESLARSDVVAYISSTAALYALYVGIPVVKLVIDDSVNDDPLYLCANLKRSVNSPQELSAAVQELAALPPDVYRREADAAAAYVAGYLREPSDETMAVFLGERS